MFIFNNCRYDCLCNKCAAISYRYSLLSTYKFDNITFMVRSIDKVRVIFVLRIFHVKAICDVSLVYFVFQR